MNSYTLLKLQLYSQIYSKLLNPSSEMSRLKREKMINCTQQLINDTKQAYKNVNKKISTANATSKSGCERSELKGSRGEKRTLLALCDRLCEGMCVFGTNWREAETRTTRLNRRKDFARTIAN